MGCSKIKPAHCRSQTGIRRKGSSGRVRRAGSSMMSSLRRGPRRPNGGGGGPRRTEPPPANSFKRSLNQLKAETDDKDDAESEAIPCAVAKYIHFCKNNTNW